MAKPTIRVRIGFIDGPYVVSPVWTDVTSYVREVTTNRGRQDEWQHFGTGTATVVLDNRDRRYDPTYTAGPYYGFLYPRRQIQIQGTVDNVNYYNIFRGFIAGWPVELKNAGYDSTVTLECFDVFGLLGATEVTPDWADSTILGLSPVHYWRCNEATGSTSIIDYGSAAADVPVFSGRPNLVSNEPIANGIPYNAANLLITTYYLSRSVTPATGDFTVSFWYRGGPTGTIPLTLKGTSSLLFSLVSSSIQVDLDDGVAGARVTTSRSGFGAEAAHHVVVTYTNSTGRLRIYVDGTDLTGTQVNVTGHKLIPETEITFSGGSIAQCAVFTSVLSTTNIANIYKLSAAQITESTSARLTRLTNLTSLTSQITSSISTVGVVSDISSGRFSLLSEMETVSDSEGGDFFVTNAGVGLMTNRTYTTTNTNSITNQATFGSGGIPIGTEMSYYWSADDLRNQINVTWSGDAVATATNSTSVTAYGTSAENYETQLSTQADAQSLANYLVGFGYLPRLVMSAVEVGQALTTAQWATVLGLELLERITVVVPEQVGSNLSQIQLVQQIQHRITPGDWKTTILGSSRWSSVFTIGTSYLDGTDILG